MYPPSPMMQKRPFGFGVPAGTPGPGTWGGMPGARPTQPTAPAIDPTGQQAPAAQMMPGAGGSSQGAFYGGQGRSRGSYNSEAAGSNGAAPGWAGDTIKNRYTDAMNRSGDLAERGENDFFDRAEAFNPQQSINDYATGAFNTFRKQMGQDMGDLRGQEVGMGRLNTGFGTEDEDRLMTRGLSDLSDKILGASVTGAQMQQRNNESLGEAGLQYGNRYVDQISGQLDQKTAEQNAKKKGGIGSFLKGAAQVGSMLL